MTYAYLRISTNQAKQSNSFLVQEKALRERFQIDSVINEGFHKRKNAGRISEI